VRREQVAGGLLAALGIVVLVVAVIALRHPTRDGSSAGSATRTITIPPRTSPSAQSPSHSTPRSTPSPTRSSTPTRVIGALPLKVLNATSTPNLATQAADRFRAGGWTVTAVDENYANNILSTAVYYDPAVSNAKAAGQALQKQFPTIIKRVVPKFSPLVDGPLVVILTADYPSG
jgi:LytR cell envelope-related transcriptional attenuator